MTRLENLLKSLLTSEGGLYLIFGGLTTLLYMAVRFIIFPIVNSASVAAVIANIISILFAFITNDTIVFRQERDGYLYRFIKFITARLATFALDVALAWIFVTKYPHIIGQFVNDNPKVINTVEMIMAQVLIIALNYLFSKLFIFNNTKQ
ncbi:GtrA family protein [Streptococcus sp. zg-JUN1979]|uniref:GtrA family protein n=1 Tax=Streptococcus sp. zg-JUN1979 TaxID=3391450 RepID=UPI0039A512DD